MCRLAGLQRRQTVHHQKPINSVEGLICLVDLQCRQAVFEKISETWKIQNKQRKVKQNHTSYNYTIEIEIRHGLQLP